ncbi:MAG: cysteine synthase A [Firmicutes bacterium]|nr:cysteine synthase A [Bacillota bacterium]
MAKIYGSVAELTGHTPLMEVRNIEKAEGLEARLLIKLEYLNPAGSAKDRVARAMIEDAEARGILKQGSTIIEPTSGNTGIGLASIAASRGYRVVLTMPETMSVERRNILKAYGAEIVLTEGSKGMAGAIAKAEELAAEIEGSFIAGQFVNPVNPKAHYDTTGPEIWEDTGGNVDILIAGVGTGGTLSGTGRYLKDMDPDVRVIAMEPENSAVLSGGRPGPHAIQGIGGGFIPETLDTTVYDEVITIDDVSCFDRAKQLGRLEGILVGISAGAALEAGVRVAKRPENRDKTIVVILPDSGDRYYSTKIFTE